MIVHSVFDALTKEFLNPIYLDILAFAFIVLSHFCLASIIYRLFIMPSHNTESEILDEELSSTYQLNGEDIDI